YHWDAHNQLTEFITPEGTRWRYRYDAFGRRISKRKEVDSTLEATNLKRWLDGLPDLEPKPTAIIGYDYLWSGDQLIEETPVYADGTVGYEQSIHWLYEPGKLTPSARYEQGQLHYVVSDHQGTVREICTEAGKVAWAGRLFTWGEPEFWTVSARKEETVSCNLRFCGQYEDEESGLFYNRFRYYSPETGQYLSPDPLGLAGGVNPYGYVHDPVSFVDPLGLSMLALPAPRGTDPWMPNTPIESIVASKGGIYANMALSPEQVSGKWGLGSWATTDAIPDVGYVREKLAVIPEFKKEISHVQRIFIPEGTRIQVGIVGPQKSGGQIYSGGGTQVQILNRRDLNKIFILGEPRKLTGKCGA
ncbi:RHS repeat domain-containing protein, partial [Photorhabdus khanii]